jgi:hypothetical protein
MQFPLWRLPQQLRQGLQLVLLFCRREQLQRRWQVQRRWQFDDWKKVGELIGLGAVKRSIKAAFDEIENQLCLLEETVDSLPLRDYRRWANWGKSVDGRVEAIELLILEGRRFFCKANLVQLRLLPMDNSARTRLGSLRFEYYEEPGERVA